MADEFCPRLYFSGSYRQCYNLLSASNCILIFLLFYIIVSELEKERKMLSFRDTLIMINNKLTCQLKVCSLYATIFCRPGNIWGGGGHIDSWLLHKFGYL